MYIISFCKFDYTKLLYTFAQDIRLLALPLNFDVCKFGNRKREELASTFCKYSRCTSLVKKSRSLAHAHIDSV